MKQSSQPKSLLVVRLSALGDVAMTIPAIYSLAMQHPEQPVKVLTLQPFARLFIGKPANVTLIAVAKADIKGLKGLVRLLRLLSKEDIGLVADLHNVLRSWLVDAYFRLCGRRVAMLDKGRKARLTLLRERGSGAQHKAYTTRYFEVFRRLGFAVEPAFTTVLEHDTAQPDFTAVLPDAEKTAIGIAPFARYQNKTYPLQLMEQVVAQLSADGRFRVLLFSGGKHEREQMEAWQGRYPNTLSVAGRYSLDDEIRLMARVRVMVTMDSANMHLASLVGTPVVSVWGSTTPQCGFMGWGQQQAHAMLMGCDCQPCTIAGSNSCRRGDFRCLQFAPDALCRRIVSLTKLPL